MKFTGLLAGVTTLSVVFAYPGMGNMMGEIASLARTKRDAPAEMIGDLIKGNTTATGTLVKMCLNGEIDCYDDSKKVTSP